MKKQIRSFIVVALLTLWMSTGISHATQWVGDLTLGSETTPSVSLFRWENKIITWDSITLSLQAELLSVIDTYQSEISTLPNGTTTTLNVEFRNDSDPYNDFFTMKNDSTLIASGLFDVNKSIYDYDNGVFWLLGSVTSYASNVPGPGFSGPSITGFEFFGSTDIAEVANSYFTSSSAVPEPSTMMLSGLGLAGLLFAARRKRVVSNK